MEPRRCAIQGGSHRREHPNAHKIRQVTRRDGLSSSESNILVAAGMLRGKSTANYLAKRDGKSKIFHDFTIFFVGSIFPPATEVVSWCMQSLSSVHAVWKKFKLAQGFHAMHCCGRCALFTCSLWAAVVSERNMRIFKPVGKSMSFQVPGLFGGDLNFCVRERCDHVRRIA